MTRDQSPRMKTGSRTSRKRQRRTSYSVAYASGSFHPHLIAIVYYFNLIYLFLFGYGCINHAYYWFIGNFSTCAGEGNSKCLFVWNGNNGVPHSYRIDATFPCIGECKHQSMVEIHLPIASHSSDYLRYCPGDWNLPIKKTFGVRRLLLGVIRKTVMQRSVTKSA